MDEAERIIQTGNMARKVLLRTVDYSDNPERVRELIYEQELVSQEMEKIDEALLLLGKAVCAAAYGLLDCEDRTSERLMEKEPKLRINRPALRHDHLGLVRDIAHQILAAIAAGEQQNQPGTASPDNDHQ